MHMQKNIKGVFTLIVQRDFVLQIRLHFTILLLHRLHFEKVSKTFVIDLRHYLKLRRAYILWPLRIKKRYAFAMPPVVAGHFFISTKGEFKKCPKDEETNEK